MGAEVRLHVEPPLTSLDRSCEAVFATSEFRRIPTSLLGLPGVGVQHGDAPQDPSWPHSADLYLQPDGVVYLVAHDARGSEFMRTLVEQLRQSGHEVVVDDDV